MPSCSDHSGSSSSRCQWRGRVREGEEHVIFFFGGKRRSPSAKPSRRSQGEEGVGRGARLRHRLADPHPPSAVVRHERDPRPWSCRPSFGTDLRELREHLRRCLLWVLEGRGRLVVGPHGPAAPHEGVKDSRSGLHILSLSLSLSLWRARPCPWSSLSAAPASTLNACNDAFQKLTPFPPSLTPLAIEFRTETKTAFAGESHFLGQQELPETARAGGPVAGEGGRNLAGGRAA